MINGIRDALRSFGDGSLRDSAAKDPNLMKQLVEQYFHCG